MTSDAAEIRSHLSAALADRGDLNLQQVSAMVELSRRLLVVEPTETEFVRNLALLANQGEREANDRNGEWAPWAALAQALREVAQGTF